MNKALLFGLLLVGALCTEVRIVNDFNMIKEINKITPLWQAGYNERFADMYVHQVKRMLGVKKNPEIKLKVKQIIPLTDLPENFDLRQQYPQCDSLKEIRDQSACGSCWAFGAAEAMSDRMCIASKGELQTRISTENILSCCETCGNGCDGGDPASAWQWWVDNGIPTGGLYNDTNTCQPYAFPPCDHHIKGKYGPCPSDLYPTPDCSSTCVPGYPKKYQDDLIFASDAYSIDDEETKIMTEIYQHGSVEAAFQVYEDFLSYKSGVYHHVTGDYLGGHAIKLIGWGVENSVKYWQAVNSWDEGWGDSGTFKILKGEDHCGIESDIVAGTPKLPHDSLKYLE